MKYKQTTPSSFKRYLTQRLSEFESERGTPSLSFVNKTTQEDDFSLKKIEEVLIKYRGYEFKLPRKKESVIHISSGGLDSISMWDILLKKYQFKVFPLHFSSNPKEDEAFNFFSKFYMKRYPNLSHTPYIFSDDLFFKMDGKAISAFAKDFGMLIPNLIKITSNRYKLIFCRSTMRLMLLALRSFEYALYLQATKNIKIRTIFVGIVPEDTAIDRAYTLTVLRALNLAACLILGNFSFQYTSIALEANSGHFYTAKDMARFASKDDIPLEKSYSCDRVEEKQCGKCRSCHDRKNVFKFADVVDKTDYNKK